jgi:hypothetical protein
LTDSNGLSGEFLVYRQGWYYVTISKQGYETYTGYVIDDVIYLVKTIDPMTLTLTWNNTGDYDLSYSSSVGYSFSKNRDITSPPGGEIVTVNRFTDDANLLIYAIYFNYNDNYNMTRNPPTLTANWGDQNYVITYDGDQQSAAERYWIIACINGVEFNIVNDETSAYPSYSYCSQYD